MLTIDGKVEGVGGIICTCLVCAILKNRTVVLEGRIRAIRSGAVVTYLGPPPRVGIASDGTRA